ncbi:MAG: M20/M25/M40 family metallo-hydrolase, partial [Anaerolineae bacterium]|nr:M20/M25/M40 family metallo-hydrolase [Anaerolineae bacterium]
MKRLSWLILFLVTMPVIGGVSAQDTPDFVTIIETGDVMPHVAALAVDIGARPAGSKAETQAAAYIAAAFEAWSYTVTIQEFDLRGGRTSRNVIATRPGDEYMIVIGAHMDSVTAGTGAGDNASGVAAVLAAAEALAGLETTHTLVFVTFGAEELEYLSGADVFVESLDDDVERVIAMINV